jgi:ferredoxin
MALHVLTVAPDNVAFVLPTHTPMTDIEYEAGGQDLIPFGCRMGACGACVIEVISGGNGLNPREDNEADFLALLGYAGPEYRLACQCRLQGSVTVQRVD